MPLHCVIFFCFVFSTVLPFKPLRLHPAVTLDDWIQNLCVTHSFLKISDLFCRRAATFQTRRCCPASKSRRLHAFDLLAAASHPHERVTSIQLYGAIYHCVAYQRWIRAPSNEGAAYSHYSLGGSIRPLTSSGFTGSATLWLNHTLIEFKCADREAPL